jgi:hypothetical protein
MGLYILQPQKETQAQKSMIGEFTADISLDDPTSPSSSVDAWDA